MSVRRRRRLPRATVIAIEIAVFAGLFAAVLIGLGYARDRLDRMVGQLQEQISGQVAERLGVRVRYGTVAPSALRALQVTDLELVTEAGDVLLSASRLRVHYSLRTLLNTRSAVDAVNRVELTGVVADIHLPRDQVPVTALAGLGAAADGGTRSVLPWPLDVADARVTVTTGAGRVHLAELYLRLEPEARSTGDRLRLVDGRARLGAALTVGGHATEIDTRIRVDGYLESGQASAAAAVQLSDVQTTLGTLAARDFQVVWDGTAIFLTTPEGDAGPELALKIDPQQGLLRVGTQAQGMRPSDVFRPAGPLEHLLPWFDTTVSGAAAVEIAGGGVDYTATIRVSSPPAPLTELLGVPVEGEITVRGDAAVANVEPLVMRMAGGSVRFDGSIDLATGRAAGRLAATDLGLYGRPVDATAGVEADLQASRLALRNGVLGIGSLTAGGVTGNVSLTGSAVAGGTGAPSLQIDLAAVLPDSPDGRTTAAGSLTLGALPAFAGSVSFQEVNAGVLYRWLQPAGQADPAAAELAGGLAVSAQLEGSVDSDRLDIDVVTASVTEVDGPLRARFSGAVTRESARITALDVASGDSFRAAGSAEISAEHLSFSGRISLDGEPVPGTIRMRAGDGLTVQGPYDLMLELWPGERLPPADALARIVAGGDGRPTPFRLSAAGYPLPALSDRATAAVELAGTVARPPALLAGLGPGAELDLAAAGVDLTDSRLVVQDLPVGELPNRLEVDFAFADDVLTADRFRFTNEYFTDRGTAVTGNGVLRVTNLDRLDASGQLLLQVGQEEYEAAVSIAAGDLEIDAGVQRLPLNRLAAPLSGTASGRIRLTGPIAQPVISAELTSSDIPLNDDYLTLAVAGTYDGSRLTIGELAADYRDLRLDGVTGSVDTQSGTVALEGRYEGEYLGGPMSLDVAVTGTAAFAVDPEPDLALPTEAALTVTVAAVTVGGQNRPPWDARLRWQDGGLSFAGGPLDGLSGTLSPDGSFEVAASAPLPLQGTARGALSDAGIAAELSIDTIDLTLLNDLLQTTAVVIRAGSAAGTLRVRGTLNDPDLYGILQATGVIVDSPLITQRVGPVAFPVIFDEKDLILERTRPERGVAPVEVSGTVRMAQREPIAYDLDVRTTTAEGVPVDYPFGPVSIAGIAHGGIRISGDQSGTRIAGAVGASAARVFIEAVESPAAWEPLTVDLAVTTGQGVELTWPSEDLPILNMLADSDQSVSIRYDGFTGDYSVVGDVALRGGDLFFNRTFDLRDGMVSFTGGEMRFDPTVTVRAETRGRLGNETVRIYVDVDSRLSTFDPQNVRISSDPPRRLPELREWLGMPFGNVASDEQDLLALAGGAVSQFGLIGPMEREVRESFGLDLFSIRTDFLSNLLRAPLDVPGSSPDLLDNTTIVVGKYIGDDLFFEGRVRVESDDAISEPRPDLELSLEWATPFFLLESLLPSLNESFQPELSLSWRFTY